MKSLFLWFPSLMVEFVKSKLPRAVFYYKPSTEQVRAFEQDSRNVIRLAAYQVKRLLK